MALVKNITLESGVNLPNAYIKVSEVIYYNYAYRTPYVDVIVSVFKDQAARESGKVEVFQFNHRTPSAVFTSYFTLDILSEEGINVISQAYTWMLTMDIYSGATTVDEEGE